LTLVARAAGADDPDGGSAAAALAATCTRIRAAVAAAVTQSTIHWCEACGVAPVAPRRTVWHCNVADDSAQDVGSDDGGAGPAAHPPPLPVRLPALAVRLRRLPALRSVTLLDRPTMEGEAASPGGEPPCAAPYAVRARGWRAAGAALAATRTRRLMLVGAATAALDGIAAAGGLATLTELRLDGGADAGRGWGAAGVPAAGLAAAAPRLTSLDVRATTAATVAALTAAGPMPALLTLTLYTCGAAGYFVGRGTVEPLGRSAAAALAAACPRLNAVAFGGRLGRGAGGALSAPRGAWPRLAGVTVQLSEGDEATGVGELTTLLAGRSLAAVCVSADGATFRSAAIPMGPAVADAVAGLGRLPAKLDLSGRDLFSVADVARLAADGRAAADVEELHLGAGYRQHPAPLLAAAGRLPRLKRLRLGLDFGAADRPAADGPAADAGEVDRAGGESPPPNPWAGFPALAELHLVGTGGVTLGGEDSDGPPPGRAVGALLAALPTAPCRTTLTTLSVRGELAADVGAVLAPLRGLPALRHLTVTTWRFVVATTVREWGGGRAGPVTMSGPAPPPSARSQAAVRRALAAAMPRVAIKVVWT